MNEFENKKEEIKRLLEQGMKPEEIAEEVGCSLRYVYLVKSEIGMIKEKEPSTKDHITDIRERLESVSEDIHKLTLTEEGFFVICPACGKIFSYESGEVCEECLVIFCSSECVLKHKEKGWLEELSKCDKNSEVVLKLIEGETPQTGPEEVKEPVKNEWY